MYSELLKPVLLGMGTFREVWGPLSSLDYEYLSTAQILTVKINSHIFLNKNNKIIIQLRIFYLENTKYFFLKGRKKITQNSTKFTHINQSVHYTNSCIRKYLGHVLCSTLCLFSFVFQG